MPKFKSVNGRWIPVDVVAKNELELLGKTHLGGHKPVGDVSSAASIEEPTGKPLSKEDTVKKEKILGKRGEVSKTKKRKVF